MTGSRSEAVDVVAELRAMGASIVILPGDSEGAARAVAEAVQADEYRAQAIPSEKIEWIRSLQARGKVVAMVETA